MAGKIIFAAHLWLPPSANEANGVNTRTGAHFKTTKVLDFRDKVQKIITYWSTAQNRQQFAPHFILYMDHAAIEEARWAYKSRSKAALAARKWYRMDVLEVTHEDRRDTDNGHKELQDGIFRAIININDKRVVDIHRRSLVNPTSHEHCEVVIRETERDWCDGELLRQAALDLSLQAFYESPYSEADIDYTLLA